MPGIVLVAVTGCVPSTSVVPADQNAANQTWRYDCCDPSLNAGIKDMCKAAAKDADHVLWDQDKNRYEFIWSECKVGKEPWRKWED